MAEEHTPVPIDHTARPRICSGSCKFFAGEYDHGRKVPGAGHCQKHDSQTHVQVGIICLWAQDWRDSTHVEHPMVLHR